MILAALLVFMLAPLTVSASGSQNAPSSGGTTTLVYYLWGSEGVASQDILNAINVKLKADINAVLEVKYIDWPEVNTRYPLLFASGEQFDMSHASPGAAAPYFTLAAQGALADITDLLDTAAPALKAAIPASVWNGTKFNGRIYGVPTLYSEFTMYGYAYSRNLLQKYGLPAINSIASLEAYMDAVVKNETYPPLNGQSEDAVNLYRMLIALTSRWLEAPGLPSNQLHLVTTSPQNYRDIIHPAFTQEFEDWAVLMHEWSARGYWPRDVLSSQVGAKTQFNNGNSGGFITHQPDWTGNYGALQLDMPGVESDFWCFAETNNKIVRKMGVENSTVISVGSKNTVKALQAIEKFMTDESYYRLIQYGIQGRQYDIANGVVIRPSNYNADVDGGGFAVWSLRNDKFNIPMESEDPRRYTQNAEWDKVAINNPYVGFSFNPAKVSTEISSITNVNSQLGIQIMFGKTNDPKEAVARYRAQLTQAGIERVIAEVKSQLANFTPVP
jgi:putative aldouronate transport system substrate-binding protein